MIDLDRILMNLVTGMITMAAMLAMPALAAAQETTGRYATHDGTSTVREMPDGSKVQVTHYSQIRFAHFRGWRAVVR